MVFSALIIAVVLPTEYAKILVTLAMITIAVSVCSNNYGKYFTLKLFLFLGLLPGITQAVLFHHETLVRFVPLALLVLGFPYRGVRISYRALKGVVLISISWLIVTQLMLATGSSLALNLRDVFYPIELNVWDFGIIDITLLGFKDFRAGGIYYNPNVIGLIYLLFTSLYLFLVKGHLQEAQQGKLDSDVSKKSFVLIDWLALIFGCLGIWLSGSLTALFALVGFLLVFIPQFRDNFSVTHIPNKLLILVVYTFISVSIAAGLPFLVTGFFDQAASGNIKIQMLLMHLQATTPVHLFFGGIYDAKFDSEFPFWIAVSGFLGLASILVFFFLLCFRVRGMLPVAVLYFLGSLGNTLLYGLLTASVMVPLIILSVAINQENYRRFYCLKKPGCVSF